MCLCPLVNFLVLFARAIFKNTLVSHRIWRSVFCLFGETKQRRKNLNSVFLSLFSAFQIDNRFIGVLFVYVHTHSCVYLTKYPSVLRLLGSIPSMVRCLSLFRVVYSRLFFFVLYAQCTERSFCEISSVITFCN